MMSLNNALDLTSVYNNDKIDLYIINMFKNASINEVYDIILDYNTQRLKIKFKHKNGLADYKSYVNPDAKYIITKIQSLYGLQPMDKSNTDRRLIFSDSKTSYRASQIYSGSNYYITIRILKNKHLSKKYFPSDYTSRVTDALMKSGVIIISGSTCSRKSTFINTVFKNNIFKNKNIITIEDPIEYINDNYLQIEVSERSTFSDIFKRVLRHNPDIVYVGEVRDQESASVAIEASKSGHVVITTTHANDIQSVKDRWSREFKVSKHDLENYIKLISHQRIEKNTLEVVYE